MRILILFLLLLTCTVQAQDIAQISLIGEPQIAEGELIDNNRRDVNGRLAAGLIVETDLTNLSFESRNGIIGTTTQPGRYFVFLSPDERIVYIRSNGFKQLTLYLNDVGIRLKSGQVWKIDVTGQRPANLLPINIQVDQTDARILIDGDLVDNSRSIPIAAGSHTVRIEKEEYKTIVESIEVSDAKTLFSYQMEKVLAQAFTITSEPRGATVLIDDQVADTPTPYQTFKYPGLYQVTVTLPGYKVATKTVELTEEKPVNEKFILQKSVATVTMNARPLGAKVMINGRDYTGQNRIELAAGTYFIEVSKQGYEAESMTVTLKEYEQKTVDFNLSQLVGTLQIACNEPDAQLIIKGQSYIKTITGLGILRDIPAGVYEITAKLDGYVDIVETVYVKENDVTPKRINFTDEQKGAFVEEQKRIQELNDKQEADRRRKAAIAAAAKKRRDARKWTQYKLVDFSSLDIMYNQTTIGFKGFEDNIATNYGIAASLGFLNSGIGLGFNASISQYEPASDQPLTYDGNEINAFIHYSFGYYVAVGFNINTLNPYARIGLDVNLLNTDWEGDDSGIAFYNGFYEIGFKFRFPNTNFGLVGHYSEAFNLEDNLEPLPPFIPVTRYQVGISLFFN